MFQASKLHFAVPVISLKGYFLLTALPTPIGKHSISGLPPRLGTARHTRSLRRFVFFVNTFFNATGLLAHHSTNMGIYPTQHRLIAYTG